MTSNINPADLRRGDYVEIPSENNGIRMVVEVEHDSVKAQDVCFRSNDVLMWLFRSEIFLLAKFDFSEAIQS